MLCLFACFIKFVLLKISKYICDPAPGGVLEGGVRGGFPPRHGCCVQALDKICDPAPGGVLEGGCPGGVSPPATAAVSKYETGYCD